MRRKDREITNTEDLLKVVGQCKVLHLALQDECGLYIIPLNFGYEYQQGQLFFYLHSAKSGRKVAAFQKNPQIAFEMDTNHQIIEGEKACQYGYAYASVTGTGEIVRIDNLADKKDALNALMRHQTGKDFSFTDQEAGAVAVYRIIVQHITGKEHKFPL